MGHTHYWSFRKLKGKVRQSTKAYESAIIDCQRVIRAYSIANGGLSGYAAHTEPGSYAGVKVNGSRELAHEDFILRETFAQAIGSDFCKTARKPYDTVVVACLCILADRLGDSFEVSSDGDSPDWVKGLELARRVLKQKNLAMPKTIRRRLAAI